MIFISFGNAFVLYSQCFGVFLLSTDHCTINLREVIRRTHADKNVRVFNVGDELLVHAFNGHLIVSIMNQLDVKTTEDLIDHNISKVWLQETADKRVTCTLMPVDSIDPMYKMHRSFLHHTFVNVDLREAIKWENILSTSRTTLEILASFFYSSWLQQLCQ